MLWKLPPDLQAMSWQWVPPELRARQQGSATWYTVVYARPFDRGVDDDHLAVYFDGGWWVRVSTERHRCASWDDAYRKAIALMRGADAKRRGGWRARLARGRVRGNEKHGHPWGVLACMGRCAARGGFVGALRYGFGTGWGRQCGVGHVHNRPRIVTSER